MWTSEMVGMLWGLALTKEGRDILKGFNPEGVPDALFREFIIDLKEGSNEAKGTLSRFLEGVGVKGGKNALESFVAHVTKLSKDSMTHGPRYHALKTKAEVLYRMTRFQNGDCITLENVVQQINDLVKSIQGSSHEGAGEKPSPTVGVPGRDSGGVQW